MSRENAGAILVVMLIVLCGASAEAQSFRVQCPSSTITHPDPHNAGLNNSEPTYNGATSLVAGPYGYLVPSMNINGAIKCQQVSGGDGYSTMADGTQIFMFGFGPLSGLADIAAGHPGTEFPSTFNETYSAYQGNTGANPLTRGDPATTDGATGGDTPWGSYTPGAPFNSPSQPFQFNGAIGLTPDVVNTINISDLVEGALPAGATAPPCPVKDAFTITAWTYEPLAGISAGQNVVIQPNPNPTSAQNAGFFNGGQPVTITCVASTLSYQGTNVISPSGYSEYAFTYELPAVTANANLAAQTELTSVTVSTLPQVDGHVDPRQIMDVGVMNGNIPAPLIAVDEDDELFLTLTNVGMIMRPDLFEQHTIHWHGYPNASSFYDGVPDASVAINIGGSFTYYYLAPDAGTYFWHCHITPPEHLQMGMVGQLYVRPRQNRVPASMTVYQALQLQQNDLRTACNPAVDDVCSTVLPAQGDDKLLGGYVQDTTGTKCNGSNNATCNPNYGSYVATKHFVYDDGDGSTQYDTEYPLQIHDFDPNFHFVGMTFNPEMFADMKGKYFLLNGRSYPDTVTPGPQATVTSDGQMHYSQPLPSLINIPVGGKAALRISNLSVDEYHTLQTLGIPMKVVGWNAKLLRDQDGNNTEYYTNSVTLGGGESLDVILDASDAGCGSTGCSSTLYPAGSVFYLYTSQLDELSNDAENFGGLMTEVHICKTVTGGTSFGNTCNNN